MFLLDSPYLTRWEAGLFVSHLTWVAFWADHITGCSDVVKCPKWCWPHWEPPHHRTQSCCLCWKPVCEWGIKSGWRILLQMQVLMGFYHFSSVKLQVCFEILKYTTCYLILESTCKNGASRFIRWGQKSVLSSLASICANPALAGTPSAPCQAFMSWQTLGISQMKHLILLGNLRSFADLCSYYVSSSFKLAHRPISH